MPEGINIMEMLEEKIGYVFKNKQYLQTALIHSSYANESKNKIQSNERQEFLGDTILGLIVSNYLFNRFPQYSEGELTRMRSFLVCEKALYGFAQKINLNDYILLGKGERSVHGSERPSIMADTFEAIIAAIYLDGGIDFATQFVLPFVEEMLKNNKNAMFEDYKTILQEVIQQNPEEHLEYILAKESGPDHNKKFTINVCLNTKSVVLGSGTGKSKKEAEQQAAKKVLELMGYHY